MQLDGILTPPGPAAGSRLNVTGSLGASEASASSRPSSGAAGARSSEGREAARRDNEGSSSVSPPSPLDILSSERFLISPHPQAPLFNGHDWRDKVQYVLEEVSRGNFPATQAFMSLYRQLGFVNLWFFEKYILGTCAAYDKLNDKLHLDMCNFRQRCYAPGTMAAAFIPRAGYKSTIFTTGGNTHEIIRNPDIRIGVFSSIAERAQDFCEQTKRNIAEHALMKELYPEFVPSMDNGTGWTKRGAIVPNRTHSMTEPTIRACTAGGSTQGIHVDLASMDDLVGDAQLNADRGATADMYALRNWFQSNRHSLLINPTESRVFLSATRYSLDDPYEEVMLEAKEHVGYWDEIEDHYPVDPEGEWVVYYRMAVENGESILPEQYSVEWLNRLAKTDPWTYQTQYLNNPIANESIEFAKYPVRRFKLEYLRDRGWYITLPHEKPIPLSSCSITVALDPAASEKFVSIRTSRTALVTVAQDASRRKFVLTAKVGFVPTTTWFDWLFEEKRKWGDMLGRTVVEQQAGFKALESLIRTEQTRRGEYLHYDPIPALGDKVVTIRNIIQPELERGNIFLNEDCSGVVETELNTFPASARRDVLDAMKIAIKFSRRPLSDEEEDARVNASRRSAFDDRSPTTGY